MARHRNKLRREGDCFTQCTQKMLDSGVGSGFVLVHGLPTGQGGQAQLAGQYPHAWIEYHGQCWDPGKDDWFHKDLYYQAGEIKYTQRYTLPMVEQMLVEHETYGPWDSALLARDEEIDEMRVSV